MWAWEARAFPPLSSSLPRSRKKIDYVIVNCAECEPYLTSDYRKMLEEPEKLISGLKVSLSLFENARGILAVEDNKPDCVELLKKLTKDEAKITGEGPQNKISAGVGAGS